MSGKLQPLTIEGYKDENFSSQVGSYTAMLNPESYSHSLNVQYSEEQGAGTPDASIKYEKSTPSSVNFDLVFDATGVVDKNRTDLTSEITKFKKVAYDYNGSIHSPNFLKLIWGKAMLFKCRLTTMKINYTLFKPDGSPLRAKVSVTFKEFQNPSEAMEDNSPDMTHVKTVIAGEQLPALTYDVYQDESQMLMVAEHNKLDTLMHIKPGTKLYFPPLVVH
ncbi:MAG: LysM peptidoglycan-binding domain-containing protein [Reichenbachiella sp.]|uniref:CIS tube protein n=1 Tax=Reichenbachiella sp. TaxID=2184521 RepID=UPI0029660E4E|nr:LysM peptidoglycan-binding domain-containing protein [Reichenbachiella sp.]MDW3211150.1 LysM peptidoglycan-binding domain-containing protein [Reichenbachiella sp.]